MEETVSRTASNLLPLMILLLAVFGLLIGLALVLRTRVRAQAGPGVRPARARRDAAGLQPGDVVSVLGRSCHVRGRHGLSLEGGAEAAWGQIEQEDGTAARLLLRRDGLETLHFPGRAEAPLDFPERIEREEGAYQLRGAVCELAPGWRLALYRGPGERHLALERNAAGAVLWRGKAIPTEGVTVLEDDGATPGAGAGAARR